MIRRERREEIERDREFLSCKERSLKKAMRLKKEGEVGGRETEVEVGLNRQTVASLP